MNAQAATGYVQTPCPRCGAAAWGHMHMVVGCPACGQPIGPLGAAPQQPMAPQPAYVPPQQAQPAPAPAQHQVKVQLPYGIKIPIKLGGAGSQAKIIGVVVLGIVIAVAGVFIKMKLGNKTAKGNLSYSSLGIDAKKADPDRMLTAVSGAATTWRKDAAWWSINLQKVKADGTVDVTEGGAQVVYISVGGVQSLAKSTREDSIKKFNFGPAGVDHKQLWGATDPWEGVVAPPLPTCGIKDVVKILNGRGLTGNKTVRITFDPQFADDLAWHVLGEDPKLDAYYSMADCAHLGDK